MVSMDTARIFHSHECLTGGSLSRSTGTIGPSNVIEFCCFTLPTDEIIMHEGVTAVYRSNVDLYFCILGAQNENEVCIR